MPVPDFKTYCAILDRARAGHFALPAANVTSLTTANAVLRGLAESKSDGIIQISTGGGAFASGTSLKDSALGAISIAEHVHRVADPHGAREARQALPRSVAGDQLSRHAPSSKSSYGYSLATWRTAASVWICTKLS